MTKEEMQMIAFQIITYAGDAFADFYNSVDEAMEGHYEEAEALIQKGNTTLNEAHKSQMDLLTAEASGEEMEYSIMMVHAQDHLMNAINYERLAKQMIRFVQKMEEKYGG